MTSIRNTRFLQISGLILSVLVWLASSSNPTNGRTGAPSEGHCSSCHNGNNPGGFNGTLEITGMPAEVQPNIVYPLTITMTPTAGNPVRGGFQLVALDGSNVNAGNLAIGNTQTGTEFSGGREYLEHRAAKNFVSGGPVSWTFNWTAPATASGNIIKFYYAGNFGNNNNNDSGDYPVEFLTTYPFAAAADPVTATISAFSNLTCNGAGNGSITVTAGGGTAPYTYAWSNGQTSATASNLAAGTYTVTVTGAAGSGTATASKQITQPAAITATATASGSITCIQTSVNVSATATNGTSPYTYQWSNGTSGQQTSYSQAGTFTVTVTDNGGCTKTATGTIASNTTPPTAVVVTPPTLTCTNSSLTLSGAGSSTGAGFSYLWTASNGGSITSGATTLAPVINACGTYTLKVTNTTNGCTATASKNVACNIIQPVVTVTGGLISCTNPTVTLNASSNTSGVSYLWTGPCINAQNQNLQNPVVCAAGTYTVTVTNPVNGCTNSATATVTQDLNTPTVSIGTVGQLTCATPTVTIPLTGSGNMFYSWNGACFSGSQQIASPTVCAPGVYTVVVTNPINGCTSTASVSVFSNANVPSAIILPPGHLNCNNATVELDGSASSQGAEFSYAWSTTNGNIVSGGALQVSTVNLEGTYVLTVTDITNGCTASATVTVVQTTPVSATATASAASCAGSANGSVAALPSNGSAPYTYLWSNGSTNAITGNLVAGTYTVTVSDADGCTAVASATVTQPSPVELTTTTTAQTALNLSDGTATAVAAGGTPGYTYAWSNGATTASISNLAPGIFTVTATDTHGCTAVEIANVNSFNCNLNASVTTEDVSCHGGQDGSASVQVTGATLPVLYQWSNSLGTPVVEGLAAGSYMVSITDAANCPLVLTAEINEPAALIASVAVTGESAIGAHDGTASVQVSGGTPTYTYAWSNNAVTASISNLAPGTYTATVTDAHNCTIVQTAVVSSVSCNLQSEMIVTPVTCFNTATGTAAVIVTGATGNLTYQWSNGATTETVNNLTIGTVTVTVTDAVGCSVTGTSDIVAPAESLEAVAINITGVPCPLDQSGSATPSITGGWGAPYSYQFSWGIGGFNNLTAGVYSFTVTDAGGCSTVAAFEIEVLDDIPPMMQCPDNIVLCGADLLDYSEPEVTDNCAGSPNTATLISGLPSGSAFIDGITTQVFSATDAAGNTSTCSFSVTVYPISDVVINNIVHDTGGSGVGSIDVGVVSDSGPFTFEWRKDGELFANTEDLTGLTAGIYTLVVTDVNGCTVQLAPVTIDNLVGTNDPGTADVKIKLWPNPAGHAFRLDLANLEPSGMDILNAQGRLVRTLEPGEWNGEISVNELPTGFYYLKVISRNGVCQVVKWVKGE
jgi:hypothetical protein